MIKNLIKNYQNRNVDLYEFFFNISVVKIHKIRFILNLKLKVLGPLGPLSKTTLLKLV